MAVMNVIKSNWLSSILILVAGVALCCLYERDNVINVIIYIIGTLFTSTGCINIISISMRHSVGTAGTVSAIIGWIAGLAGIGAGAAMLITPASFHKILICVFAVVLVCAALWHVFLLAYYYRGYRLPGWLYVSPLLLLVGGITIFFSNEIRDTGSTAILITGIGSIIFAVTTLLEFILAKESNKNIIATSKSSGNESKPDTEPDRELTGSVKDAITFPQPEVTIPETDQNGATE